MMLVTLSLLIATPNVRAALRCSDWLEATVRGARLTMAQNHAHFYDKDVPLAREGVQYLSPDIGVVGVAVKHGSGVVSGTLFVTRSGSTQMVIGVGPVVRISTARTPVAAVSWDPSHPANNRKTVRGIFTDGTGIKSTEVVDSKSIGLSEIDGAVFTEDRTALAASDAEGKIAIYGFSQKAVIGRPNFLGRPIGVIGRDFLAVASDGTVARISRSGLVLATRFLGIVDGNANEFTDVLASDPNGVALFVASRHVCFADFRDGGKSGVIQVIPEWVHAASLSSDGRAFAFLGGTTFEQGKGGYLTAGVVTLEPTPTLRTHHKLGDERNLFAQAALQAVDDGSWLLASYTPNRNGAVGPIRVSHLSQDGLLKLGLMDPSQWSEAELVKDSLSFIENSGSVTLNFEAMPRGVDQASHFEFRLEADQAQFVARSRVEGHVAFEPESAENPFRWHPTITQGPISAGRRRREAGVPAHPSIVDALKVGQRTYLIEGKVLTVLNRGSLEDVPLPFEPDWLVAGPKDMAFVVAKPDAENQRIITLFDGARPVLTVPSLTIVRREQGIVPRYVDGHLVLPHLTPTGFIKWVSYRVEYR